MFLIFATFLIALASAEELKVTVIHSPPFVVVGENDTVTGYLIDVWNKIAEKEGVCFYLPFFNFKIQNFQFTTAFSVVADGKYGVYDEETETWSGLMGEVK